MVATSNAPPTTTTPTEDAIARLKELTQNLTIAIQQLKSDLESLPGDSEIEKILINLGERHAARTSTLLATVPNSPDGLLTAVNLVQTYLQVTEFMPQSCLDEVSRRLEQGRVQHYIDARCDLDAELIHILMDLKKLPPALPPSTPGSGNSKIDELIEKTKAIVNTLSDPAIPAATKVTEWIKYLEDAERILKSDGLDLTEAQINLLIKQWGIAMETLPPLVPATEEERKQFATQFLDIRFLLENNYDLLAEILRLKDPLGFRTP